MSLVSSFICMTKRGIPVDAINVVIEYIGTTPNARWIPSFGLDGKLCWKVNKDAFKKLFELCMVSPSIYHNFRRPSTTMVINGVEQENPCSSILLIASKVLSINTIRTTMYVSVEIAPNVFNHTSVLCDIGVGEDGMTKIHFHKGVFYRPYERYEWNQVHKIVSAHFGHNIINIEHSEIIQPNVWNPELNIWEDAGYTHTPEINPYPIWVHDTEEDNIGWA